MRTQSKFFLNLIITLIIFNFLPFLDAQEKFKYEPRGERDPFVALVGPGGEYLGPSGKIKSLGDIKLEGIIWDPVGGHLAIINGEIVKEGENVGGIKVNKIYSKKIIILIDDEEFILNLVEEEGSKNEQFQTQPDKSIGSF